MGKGGARVCVQFTDKFLSKAENPEEERATASLIDDSLVTFCSLSRALNPALLFIHPSVPPFLHLSYIHPHIHPPIQPGDAQRAADFIIAGAPAPRHVPGVWSVLTDPLPGQLAAASTW